MHVASRDNKGLHVWWGVKHDSWVPSPWVFHPPRKENPGGFQKINILKAVRLCEITLRREVRQEREGG